MLIEDEEPQSKEKNYPESSNRSERNRASSLKIDARKSPLLSHYRERNRATEARESPRAIEIKCEREREREDSEAINAREIEIENEKSEINEIENE